MSRWLVNAGETQFGVDGLSELKELAQKGELGPGDMVQPPGASDWLYASEIPELAEVLPEGTIDDDDDLYPGRGGFGGSALAGVLAVVFGAILLVGSGALYWLITSIPTDNVEMFGENGLNFSQVVATEDVTLRAKAEPSASSTGAASKDDVLELLAKRADFYRVRTKGGAEGWTPITSVLPLYRLGGAEVSAELDPLYNPDRYLAVGNASWLQLDKKNEQLTVFQFQLKNNSPYDMTDLVLLATIKDSKGSELERVEFAIEGLVPANDTTMVGTLNADPKAKEGEGAVRRLLTDVAFSDLAGEDPDLQLRHSMGVEVEMKTADFTEANIDVLEVRAIPNTEG